MVKNLFEFHTGLTYEPTGDSTKQQMCGTCIFCQKEKHFYFGAEYGWDCKACQRKGNKYKFLSEFHKLLITPPVAILAQERGIPTDILVAEGIRFNQFLSSERYHVFEIPTFNSDNKLNNLLKVIPHPDKPNKRLILCTPSLRNTLYNYTISSQEVVWLLEGHWDRLAALEITKGKNITCISWPGSKFDPSWTKVFAEKHLKIFPDRDPPNLSTGIAPGQQELETILSTIDKSSVKPRSIQVIQWPDNLPAKFDVNDALRLFGPNAYEFLEGNLDKPHHTPSIPSIEADSSCKTFENLVADVQSIYYFTREMELLLLAMVSAIYSLRILGEQWWMRIQAPPGALKTTLAKLVGSSEHTVMRDTFTGILSGHEDDEEGDASLISLIKNHALIVKDADSLLTQPNIVQILGELRAFYDKSIAVTYRNRVSYAYENIRSSFMLFGTHALREMDDSALGERFLDYELHISDEDRKAIALRALQNSKIEGHCQEDQEEQLKRRSKGFIDSHLMLRSDVAELDPEADNNVLSLGSLIAYMRADVKRTSKGHVKYKPYPEVPSRIVKQLTKVYQCAPITLNTKSIPATVHELVAHIAKDIINVHTQRYLISNILHFKGPLTGQQLCEELRTPEQHMVDQHMVATEVSDMNELGMLAISDHRTSTQLVIPRFELKREINEQFKLISNAQLALG